MVGDSKLSVKNNNFEWEYRICNISFRNGENPGHVGKHISPSSLKLWILAFFIPGWADNYGKLDPSLFYQNKLHLIQKRKIMVSESIITATEDANSDQNTLLKLVIKSLTKASNKPFPRETRYFLETLLLSIYKILPNRSYLILLVTFQLNWNIILFVNLSCRFEQVAVNVSFAPVSVFQRINVARLVFCHPHLSFLANCQPCSSCDCL